MSLTFPTFAHKGTPLNASGITNVCKLLGITPVEVWTVLAVETRGFGFLPDRRPQILFERHIFHKQTGGIYDAKHPDISNPNAGGYSGGAAEYPRLSAAMALNDTAALESASWGIGQVMGFNYKSVGFAGVDAMVNDMVLGENEQLMAMANFIRAHALVGALKRHDWAAFALGYNGSSYAKNKYDVKLAAAHAKYSVLLPDVDLRQAQAALLYLGFNPGEIDGLPGKRTSSAISAFQKKSGLSVSGSLDSPTNTALFKAVGWP